MSDEFDTKANEGAAPAAEPKCLCGGLGSTVSRFVQAMAPPEAANEHFRRARIEMLKGIRELLDQRIEALSKPPENKGTKLNVE
ncbi:MAG: hypothetical protein ABL995_19705 [Bryobacteraceae bacterium]